MPNVFSKLAVPLQEWGLSMVPQVNRLVRGYVKNRTTIQRSILFILILRSILSMRQIIKSIKKSNNNNAKPKTQQNRPKSKKVEVDMTFFKQLYKLLQIVMPGIRSKEFWLLIIHSGFLGTVWQFTFSIYS